MDREHVKGVADKAKGSIKEGAGKLTGDKDLQMEGKADKAKGAVHNAVGDVKDAAKDAAEVEAEDLERMAQFDEWVEEMRRNGCADPEDPVELAKWQAEQDREFEENARLHRAFDQMEREEEEELQRIKDSRPLGVPPPIEPRSVHSAVPQPPWKRKLRP